MLPEVLGQQNQDGEKSDRFSEILREPDVVTSEPKTTSVRRPKGPRLSTCFLSSVPQFPNHPMTLSNGNSPVRQITEQILATRKITRSAQQQLMGALLSKQAISPDDRAMIDRIFDQLHRGLLHVVD